MDNKENKPFLPELVLKKISSPWLVHLMQKRSIDHTTYKWVCGECHRKLLKAVCCGSWALKT
ncbi:hypothetical protein BpHYR1_028514 [Brachionus plicatilis]|uniref:Uncharacterized protein n=1 Tax=Brachionus plicatilis TaxID=10195 RepID=A0A3M7PN70_BRAPC|nr:hypothetical protein BpHYR1_028514 [Brachionus plicatilis]